jgi:hypothetical protein
LDTGLLWYRLGEVDLARRYFSLAVSTAISPQQSRVVHSLLRRFSDLISNLNTRKLKVLFMFSALDSQRFMDRDFEFLYEAALEHPDLDVSLFGPGFKSQHTAVRMEHAAYDVVFVFDLCGGSSHWEHRHQFSREDFPLSAVRLRWEDDCQVVAVYHNITLLNRNAVAYIPLASGIGQHTARIE